MSKIVKRLEAVISAVTLVEFLPPGEELSEKEKVGQFSLAVILLVFLVASSPCFAAGREIKVPKDPSASPEVSYGKGENRDTVKVGIFAPLRERRTNEVVDLVWERRESDAWSSRAVEAAQQGNVIEAPNVQTRGAFPVVFVNDSRYQNNRVDFWEVKPKGTTSIRRSVDVAPGGAEVSYLKAGQYQYQVFDERGKVRKLENPKTGERGETFDLEVHNTPAAEYQGREFFGMIRVW